MSRRQASEAQREKGRQSAIARREILLEEQPENIIEAVRTWEMLAATKVETSGCEKKLTNTYDISSIKPVTVSGSFTL